MSNEITAEALGEFDGLVADKMEAEKAILVAKAAVKPKRQKNDKDRIEKLEKDLRAVVDMLNNMASAIGLPKSIIPNLD
jgi:hypothetical protein